MNAISQVTSLAQMLSDYAWDELGFAGMIVPDYDMQFDIANFIDTASEVREEETGYAVDLSVIFQARVILQARVDAELERREQEETSVLPGAVQLSIAGNVSWYRLGA